MKTILVLTDLTKKAENAALYALKLAEKMRANIILYHSFEKFQSVNVPEAGSWVYEDYTLVKAESLAELKKLHDYLEKHHEALKFKPEISLLNEMGYDLGTSVHQLLQNKPIDLIVMGAKSDDMVSHLFYGSDTSAVLEKTTCPVLFVPEAANYEEFKTIVFANDLKKEYHKEVSFLVSLARFNYSNIIVTHFGEDEHDPEACLDLIKNVFKYPNATFVQIPGKNIGDQLREFTTSVNADLTVMIHHQGTQFAKLIAGSKSKNMLNHHTGPILIFPD